MPQCQFDDIALFLKQCVLKNLSPTRYPDFQQANALDIGTGGDKGQTRRLLLDPQIINTTRLLVEELERDKTGLPTLHLIYEYVRKPAIETLTETEVPSLSKGKGSSKGKGKSKGLSIKKVKTEPTNQNVTCLYLSNIINILII